ncbi:radical SAM family heme chaperone HemW [Enterocloster aldenensis]|uniref:radical SAM family heme chaperone HemW n=1 Tax=Enterocloster aldenensis TaxID=358742 RepID=UPI0025A4709A|nr:radical SAM family heme chaperone HemW [Enterocloster aldenensis]
MTSRYKKPMELYVHIPFCARKCFYCDFLSFRAPEPVHEAYSAQLIREIEAQGAFCREYQVTSIFIGGGTPSVMEPCLIADIMRALNYHFDVAEDAEITIEVNPGTLLHNKLHIYREAGINRLSIGLQSTDNQELRDLGRIHTFEEFLKSYQCARMVGFPDINVDLMSSIPGQTLESFKNTLKKVTMLKPEHISAYSLIIEEGTPFWDHYGPGRAGTASFPPLPDEDTENRIYHLTRTFLGEQGYGRYEISNYAKPGHECRHNIGYWTEVPYLGLGLGASSYLGGCRFSNTGDMDMYLGLDFAGTPEEALEQLHGPLQELSREARMEEFMFLGLRLTKGVSEIDFVAMFGIKLETVFGPVIDRLISNGLMEKNGVRLSLTEWGMDVSNYVLGEFLLP